MRKANLWIRRQEIPSIIVLAVIAAIVDVVGQYLLYRHVKW
jgi:hypothetical protein